MSPAHFSALRPLQDADADRLQRALLADAGRRARAMRSARTEPYRRALARRICTDLLRALRGDNTTKETRTCA